MRGVVEGMVSFGLSVVSWMLIVIATLLIFLNQLPVALAAYAVGMVLLFFHEYLSYSAWKRKSMSDEDAGGRAVSGMLQEVVTGFALPLLVSAAFYQYIAKDGRVIVLLFMGYMAALVRLGFRALRIFKARNREDA